MPNSIATLPTPTVIDLSSPLRWLRLGWRDLFLNPVPGLLHGALAAPLLVTELGQELGYREILRMALWALVIVALVSLGLASFMLGLILVFPVLGHASWHAYADLKRSGAIGLTAV